MGIMTRREILAGEGITKITPHRQIYNRVCLLSITIHPPLPPPKKKRERRKKRRKAESVEEMKGLNAFKEKE